MDDAERWLYLQQIRQAAVRVAFRARVLQEYPRPATRSARDLEEEMARRFAAEVVFLADDLAIAPPYRPTWWRRALRRVAVRIWRIAE